ncbi:MAG: hypothetical protein JNK12_03850 [Acidimicrobiales bacterium]|nr:hypothetical protein [Acidimicrobiales bacterium]
MPLPTRRRRTEKALVAVAVGLLAVLSGAGVASAWWTSAAVGDLDVSTTTVPAPAAPAASVSSRSIVLSWPPVAIAGEVPASSYSVSRTSAEGTVDVAACTGTATTCTDTGAPIGTSRYRVTARYRTWTSDPGPATTVNVGGPVLTLPSSVSSLPTTLTGSLSGAVPRTALAFRLDDPVTGTALSGTPASVGSGPSTAVSVVLPAGTTDGTHTVYAIAGDEVTGSAVTVSVGGSPSALTWVSNRDGRGRLSDVVRVTYSAALSLASLAPNDPDGNVGVLVTVSDNPVANGNDLLRVTGASGNAVAFGEIDLGSRSFVTGTTTYGTASKPSTLVWNSTSRTLTLTLGTESGASPRRVSSSVTATYRPGAGLRTAGGGAVTGAVTVRSVAF